MYAQIVVLTYQSPEIDSYTYEIPEKLVGKVKVGQLVSVPFGKRNPLGVIVSIDNSQSTIVKNIKSISSIILEKPILLPYQIKLLTWMSAYYMAPMVNCLKALLPELPNTKRLTSNSSTSYQLPNTKYQTLVLIPSINQLPQTLAQFPQAKNYAVYTSELKPPEKFNVWQKILSGQVDFIFGSRSAIFTPCPNLKKICIFDEHENAYKDDRSPYFDTFSVAEKISELTQAQLEISDSSPKITTFSNHSKVIRIPTLQVQTKIISLSRDRKLGNYLSISVDLEEIIKRAYSKKLSILLFLNKKIESGSIFCKDCKHREFFKSQPDVCPNCQSAEIYFNSTNINSLAKEIKKILPSAEVNFIAENTPDTRYQIPDTEITIATSAVFYKLNASRFDLVAHIYADSPLNFNEFNSSEEIYSQITSLKKLTRKLLIIQTHNEDLPAIKFAVLNNYEAFYQSEIGPRKTLNYPPYSLLVKITVIGKKDIEVEKNSQKIFQNLSSDLPTTSDLQPITILGPFKALSRTAFSYNIILKIQLFNYSLNSRENVQNKIISFFSRQKDVRIIVEPKNLN